MLFSPLRRNFAIGFAVAFAVLAAAVLGVTAFHRSTPDIVLGALATGALLQFVVFLALDRAISRDAAERALAAERVRQQLSFTAAITDNLGEGVLTVDKEGRLTFMNPAAEKMIGWTEEELLG